MGHVLGVLGLGTQGLAALAGSLAPDRGQAAFAVPGISHESGESTSINGQRSASYRVALPGGDARRLRDRDRHGQPTTSVFLDRELALRVEASGKTPGDLIRAGLDAAEIATVKATVRRVVREELDA